MIDFAKQQTLRFVEREEGRFFIWLPVFLAVGIGLYFSLSHEPGSAFVALLLVAVMVACYLLVRYGKRLVVAAVLLSIVSGFAVAKLRTEIVQSAGDREDQGLLSC